MSDLVPLCTVDRDYVPVVARALGDAGIAAAYANADGRPTHCIVQVAEEAAERAAAALEARGTFTDEGGSS